jgi:integrase
MPIFPRKGSPYLYAEARYKGLRLVRSAGTISRKEARELEAALRRELEDEYERGQLTPSLTLDQACSRYWKEHGRHLRSASEIARYLKLIVAFLGEHTPLAAIGPREITALIEARRKQGAGPRAINLTLAVLRQVLNRAASHWEMPVRAIVWKNYTLKEIKDEIVVISEEEAKRFIAAFQPHAAHAARLVEFLFLSGLRKREAFNARWEHVSFENRTIRVFVKGGRWREHPVEGAALTVLQQTPRTGPLIFDRTNFRRHWERAKVEACAPTGFTVHGCRHSFASWLLARGVPIQVVSKALGHRNIAVTLKYLHIDKTDVRAGMQKLPSLSTNTDNVVVLKTK